MALKFGSFCLSLVLRWDYREGLAPSVHAVQTSLGASLAGDLFFFSRKSRNLDIYLGFIDYKS